jgi:SAM-dependent methyltransferase
MHPKIRTFFLMTQNTKTVMPNRLASTEDFEFSALNQAIYYPRAIVQEFRPFLNGNVLEVGAGIGQMARLFAGVNGVKSFKAVEPDPRFAAQFRKECPDLNLVEGLASSLNVGDGYDTITSVNVLEHIQDDVAELRCYRELLAPRSGHVCIMTPARQEIFSNIDRDFGHFRRYTKKSIKQILVAGGFKPIKICYFNLPGYFAWWLNFKLMGKRNFNPSMVRFYDQWIFRYFYMLEKSLLRPPIGQSLIAIAKA